MQGQPRTPTGWESQRHQNNANSEYIAACKPETIRTLLAERDAQATEIERLRTALAEISEYWNRDQNDQAMHDACWHAIDTANAALSGEPK